VVALLVGQALDDVESERIDVATAFRLVAVRAWTEGYRAGTHTGDFLEPPPEPPTGNVRTTGILKPGSKDRSATPDQEPSSS
jgi:hypothetical protein